MNFIHELSEGVKNFLDFTGLGIVAGVFVNILPTIVALFAAVWYLIRFYEYFKSKITKEKPPKLD